VTPEAVRAALEGAPDLTAGLRAVAAHAEHPDVGGDGELMQRVNQAREWLSWTLGVG
jgi:hypothetical protein